MSYLMSIFLGFIQGVTEFLPISSSGHLAIFQDLLGLKYSEEEHLLFVVLLHLATLVSVFIMYRKDLGSMIKETWAFITGKGSQGKRDDGRLSPSVRLVMLIIVATLPLFVAVLFNDYVESLSTNTYFVAIALVLTGTILYFSGKLAEGRKNAKTATLTDAILVGACQAVAVLPGISRSGTTITAGMACGFKREFAVKFSFLMSIPAVLGSVLISVIKAVKNGINASLIPVYLVGMLVAMVVGCAAIVIVKRVTSKAGFGKFAYYCWGMGALTLILTIVL